MKTITKIAHMADSHLRDSQYQLRLRGQDFTDALLNAVRVARDHGADIIVHGGDLLDTLRPSARTVRDLRKIHRQLVDDDMTMLVVSGNHDFTVPPWPEVIRDDNDPEWKGLVCFDNKTYDVKGVKLHGLPFMQRQDLMARCNGIVADVLVWHGMVKDFVDYPISDESEVVSMNDFPENRFQLVALGDIHVPNVARKHDDTVFCYPGSLELCKRDEPLDKGFYMHTFEESATSRAKLVNSEFITIPTRVKIAMHVGSEDDVAQVIDRVRNELPNMPLVMVTFHPDFKDTPKRLAAAIDTTRCILRVAMKRNSKSQVADRDMRNENVKMKMIDFLPRFLAPGTELFQLGQLMTDPKVDGRQALETYVENALTAK